MSDNDALGMARQALAKVDAEERVNDLRDRAAKDAMIRLEASVNKLTTDFALFVQSFYTRLFAIGGAIILLLIAMLGFLIVRTLFPPQVPPHP